MWPRVLLCEVMAGPMGQYVMDEQVCLFVFPDVLMELTDRRTEEFKKRTEAGRSIDGQRD